MNTEYRGLENIMQSPQLPEPEPVHDAALPAGAALGSGSAARFFELYSNLI